MSKKINENLLYHFGNKAINNQEKERIRTVIIKQYTEDERFLSSFIKIYNSFLDSTGFKKEIMADLIIIYMSLSGSIINLDDESCREIVNHASIETIGYYGDIILQDNLREFCVNKYWNYVFEFYGNNDKDKSKHLRRKIINLFSKDKEE